MNRRFRRLLEPGERILVRSTDGGAAWYLAGSILFLVVATWLRKIWGVPFLGFRFWNLTLFMLLFAVPTPVVAWLWTRWKWVITDRRVLRGYGLVSSEIAEMRHETVEGVRLDGGKLIVHGDDDWWEFPITRNFLRADTLYALFGARFGDSGMPAKPVQEMLEPGEIVLHRASPLFTDVLPWVVLLSGPVLLFVAVIWPEALKDWYFIPAIVQGPYVVLLGDVVAAWRGRGWQTVLTDRRLLRRRLEWPSRCDAIPLDAVSEAQWDSKGWKLVVVSPGRRDTIFCLRRTARRILDALERNDRGEALA